MVKELILSLIGRRKLRIWILNLWKCIQVLWTKIVAIWWRDHLNKTIFFQLYNLKLINLTIIMITIMLDQINTNNILLTSVEVVSLIRRRQIDIWKNKDCIMMMKTNLVDLIKEGAEEISHMHLKDLRLEKKNFKKKWWKGGRVSNQIKTVLTILITKEEGVIKTITTIMVVVVVGEIIIITTIIIMIM